MILFSTTTALALEIVYPTLPGVEAPQVFMPKVESGEYTRDQVIPLYLKYFYVLFVVFSGLIAFAALSYGGFIFLISSGNPGKIAEAKEQIISAFFGIIILLGSYIFLVLLNPNLIVLQVPSLQKAVFPPAPPISLPKQKAHTYWELPLGTIEENLLKKNEMAKIAALPLKDASADLAVGVNKRTQELNALLNQCKCSRLDSICPPSSCEPDNLCAGTYLDLCPNSSLIAQKRMELSSALANLKAKRDDVYAKTVALFKEDLRMRYTQSFLDNCRAEPFDVFTFIEMQEDKTIGSLIEKRKIWTDINPGDGSDPEIDCDQSAPDITLPRTKDKQATYNLALIWCPRCSQGGNHVLECYNDTVKKAQSAGVNPAFALIIWLNESNASNYNISYEDFGIHDSSIIGFTAQINRFLSLPDAYKASFPQCFGHGNDMDAFLRIFRSGNCTDQAGLDYVANIRTVWTFITTCPFPSYPTDTSCY